MVKWKPLVSNGSLASIKEKNHDTRIICSFGSVLS